MDLNKIIPCKKSVWAVYEFRLSFLHYAANITDSVNRVQLFSAQGKWMRTVGLTGSGQLQFRDPVGVAIGTNKRI